MFIFFDRKVIENYNVVKNANRLAWTPETMHSTHTQTHTHINRDS